MSLRRSALPMVLALICCPFFLNGCGGKPDTAASPNELDAFLEANPDVANEEAPDVEAE